MFAVCGDIPLALKRLTHSTSAAQGLREWPPTLGTLPASRMPRTSTTSSAAAFIKTLSASTECLSRHSAVVEKRPRLGWGLVAARANWAKPFRFS